MALRAFIHLLWREGTLGAQGRFWSRARSASAGTADIVRRRRSTLPTAFREYDAKLSRRHCKERRNEAIHASVCKYWIASRSLSSGAHSRDPLARKRLLTVVRPLPVYPKKNGHQQSGSVGPLGAMNGLTRHGKCRRYSITSSARASRVVGISRPSALAVRRLITSSYLVGA
jgi:hypothetical protein